SLSDALHSIYCSVFGAFKDDADGRRNARGMTVGFREDALEFRPYRRRDGENRTECVWKESPQILRRGGGGEGKLKPSTVCRLRPSSSSSGQRCSAGEK